MTALAIATATELHVDIDNEDCWLKVAATATAAEIRAALDQAEAAGLEEEEETIEYDAQGWTVWFRFGRQLIKERGMA